MITGCLFLHVSEGSDGEIGADLHGERWLFWVKNVNIRPPVYIPPGPRSTRIVRRSNNVSQILVLLSVPSIDKARSGLPPRGVRYVLLGGVSLGPDVVSVGNIATLGACFSVFVTDTPFRGQVCSAGMSGFR